MKEIDKADFYINQRKVVDLFLKGQTNLTRLAKITGFKRTEVQQYLDEWRRVAVNDKDVKERAKESLTEMDEHFSLIIKELWETVEQADNDADLKTKTTALKSIADVEAKRQDSLQKAGLYDDAELGDELVRMQEQAEQIKKLLASVAANHPEVKMEILEGLRVIFAQDQVSVPDTVQGEIERA